MVEIDSGLARCGIHAQDAGGSTPTVLANDDGLAEIDDIRPGNSLFKDRMQVALGVAQAGECALSVLATMRAS